MEPFRGLLHETPAVTRAERSAQMDGLVAKARQNDRTVRATLVELMGPALAALVRRLGLPGEREDQLQGVLTHLLSVLERFEPAGPARFSTWMTTVATRWLLMQVRAKQPDFVDVDGLELPSPRPLDPSRLAEAKELGAMLEAALEGLPAAQRRAFVLASVEGLSLPEVAACEGVPVGTIKSRLARARMALVLTLGPRLDVTDAGGGR